MKKLLLSLFLFVVVMFELKGQALQPQRLWENTKIYGVAASDTTGYALLSDLKVFFNYMDKDIDGIYYQNNAIERFRVFNDGRVSIGGLQSGSKLSILGGAYLDSILMKNAFATSAFNQIVVRDSITGLLKTQTVWNLRANMGLTSAISGTGTNNTLAMWNNTGLTNSPLSNSGSVLTSTSTINLPNGTNTVPALRVGGGSNGFFWDGEFNFVIASNPLLRVSAQQVSINHSFPTLLLNSAGGAGAYNYINFAGAWASGSTALGVNVYAQIDGYNGMTFKTVPGAKIGIAKAGVANVSDMFTYLEISNNLTGNIAKIGSKTAYDGRYDNLAYECMSHKNTLAQNDYLGGIRWIADNAAGGSLPSANIMTQLSDNNGAGHIKYDITFNTHTDRNGNYSFGFLERMRIKDNGNVLYNNRQEYDYSITPTVSNEGMVAAYNSNANKFQLTNIFKAGLGTIASPSLTNQTYQGHGFSFDANNIYGSVGGVKYLTLSSNGIETNKIKLTTGAAAGKFLQTDASGNGTWQTIKGIDGAWNTTGINNTAGTGAGESLTSGSHNQFIGYNAGNLNTTGLANTYIGSLAGSVSTTNNYNVALGWNTLSSNNADFNIAIGANALSSNTTGAKNIGIGYNEGNATTTTGTQNTFVGNGAGAGIGGTSQTTALGANATATATNSTALGYGASNSTANSVKIGNTSVTEVNFGNGSVTLKGLKQTGATGNEAISVTQADVSYKMTATSVQTPPVGISTLNIDFGVGDGQFNQFDLINVANTFQFTASNLAVGRMCIVRIWNKGSYSANFSTQFKSPDGSQLIGIGTGSTYMLKFITDGTNIFSF